MEKPIMFSKAAILAFLLVIGACVPFSQAARVPARDELQSEPAPVDDVPSQNLKKCSTYKDCKGITCDAVDSVIWHVECVNGSCHCIPNETSRAPAAPVDLQSEPAPVDDVPSPDLRKCSTYKDCKGITCDAVDSVIWHVECVNGSCHCIPNETSRAPAAPVDLQSEPAPVDDVPPQTEAVELCSSDDDCHLPICTEYFGSHLKCVAGRCRCAEPPKTS